MWIRELHTIVGPDIIIAIAGNKVDNEKARAVNKEVAEEYCRSVGAIHVLTSAKLNRGIDTIFSELVTRKCCETGSCTGWWISSPSSNSSFCDAPAALLKGLFVLTSWCLLPDDPYPGLLSRRSGGVEGGSAGAGAGAGAATAGAGSGGGVGHSASGSASGKRKVLAIAEEEPVQKSGCC